MTSDILDVFNLAGTFNGEGVSDEEIAKAERLLGCPFAHDYREYLGHSGIAFVRGHELTGLGSEKRVDVVSVTKANRKLFADMGSWYVIEEANIDGIVVWQNADGMIIATVPGADSAKLADSLVEYITG